VRVALDCYGLEGYGTLKRQVKRYLWRAPILTDELKKCVVSLSQRISGSCRDSVGSQVANSA